MSVWADQNVEARIIEVLGDVAWSDPAHHFGRPYMTAYQLAIELHRRYPNIAGTLSVQLGGAGIGEATSLSQYLARELSRRINADPGYPVEGSSLSNQDVAELSYNAVDGSRLVSSLTGSGYGLSMYRLR